MGIFGGLKPYVTKRNIISAIFAVTLTAVALVDTNFLDSYLLKMTWVGIASFVIMVLMIIMLFAGYAVVEALVQAGAALTLLIFLAQSYCDLPTQTQEGKAALVSLLAFGFLYIFFTFATEFQKTGKAKIAHLSEAERTSSQMRVATGFFLLFALLFGWAIYQVVGPIVLNLCVFQNV